MRSPLSDASQAPGSPIEPIDANVASLLYRTARAIDTAETLDDAIRVCLNAICERTGWPLAHAFVVNPNKQVARPQNVWHLPHRHAEDGLREATAGMTFLPGDGVVGQVLATGEMVWIEHIQSTSHFLRSAITDTSHISSLIAVPVKSRNATIAVLEFFTYAVAPRQSYLADFALAAGALLGRAVERYHEEQQTHAREGRSVKWIDSMPLRDGDGALRESEERLRFALDAAGVGTWDWNIRTGAFHWSHNFAKIHHLSPDSLTGAFDDFDRAIHPDDRVRVLLAMRASIDANEFFNVEYRVTGQRAAIHWVEGKGRVIRDDTGQPIGMAGISIDVTQRRMLEDRFRIAVEASPSAFVMVNEAGTITLVNSQTERLFGYSRHELLGQQLELLVPQRFRHGHPAQRRAFHANPHARPMGAGFDLYCLRKDGTEIPVEIGLSPIDMPEGTFVLSAIVDITERKRAEDAIRRMNNDLRQKNQEMEQFVYTVSHDLKSPIVTIMGFLGMLKEDVAAGNTEQVFDSVRRIERATNRMSELIDDLLQLSRIGRVRAEPEDVDVSALVHEIVDELHERIAQKCAHVTVQPDMPHVHVDRKRFVDVFENLLTNALKYGCDHERPQVDVGGMVEGNEVKFCVRDNGHGIEKEYQTRIFGLFQRLENEQDGTGIGLAIVARVVEVHGGRAWVESSPGHGATFWIALPKDRTGV